MFASWDSRFTHTRRLNYRIASIIGVTSRPHVLSREDFSTGMPRLSTPPSCPPDLSVTVLVQRSENQPWISVRTFGSTERRSFCHQPASPLRATVYMVEVRGHRSPNSWVQTKCVPVSTIPPWLLRGDSNSYSQRRLFYRQ